MSRRKRRKSMADSPVTRRYVARVAERLRQDVMQAISAGPTAAEVEALYERVEDLIRRDPIHAVLNLEPVSPERLASVLDWGEPGSRSN